MDKKEMKELIEEEGIGVNNPYCCGDTCEECSEIEICHSKAVSKLSSEFARNCSCGGYESEEAFWENL